MISISSENRVEAARIFEESHTQSYKMNSAKFSGWRPDQVEPVCVEMDPKFNHKN